MKRKISLITFALCSFLYSEIAGQCMPQLIVQNDINSDLFVCPESDIVIDILISSLGNCTPTPYKYHWFIDGNEQTNDPCDNCPTLEIDNITSDKVVKLDLYDDDDNLLGSNTITVEVVDTPVTGSIIATSSPICEGISLGLQAVGVGGMGAYSYMWSNPSGLTTVLVTDFDPMVNEDYEVVITDAQGCSSEPIESDLTINAVPDLPNNITLSYITDPVCEGVPFTIVLVGANTMDYTYDWLPPNAPMLADVDVETVIDPSDESMHEGTWTLTVTNDTSMCPSTTTIDVELISEDDLSIPILTADPTNMNLVGGYCNDLNSIQLNLTMPNFPPLADEAYSPDGTGPGEVNNELFLCSGLDEDVYTVTYTASYKGCLRSTTVDINMNEILEIESISDLGFCEGEMMDIVVLITGGVTPESCLWTNADNSFDQCNIGVNADPSYSGFYDLQVTDNIGCINDGLVELEVTGNINVQFSLDPAPDPDYCQNEITPVTINRSPFGDSRKIKNGNSTMQTGSGEVLNNLLTEFHLENATSPGISTLFDLTYVVSQGFCTDSVSINTFFVHPTPEPYTGSFSVCIGNSEPEAVDDLVGANSGSNIFFVDEDTLFGAIFQPNFFPVDSYTINYTSIDTNGCVRADNGGITANVYPQLMLDLGDTLYICSGGDPVIIIDTLHGGSGNYETYNWIGPGEQDNDPSMFNSFELSSDTIISLTVTDDIGCMVDTFQIVQILEPILVTLEFPNFCSLDLGIVGVQLNIDLDELSTPTFVWDQNTSWPQLGDSLLISPDSTGTIFYFYSDTTWFPINTLLYDLTINFDPLSFCSPVTLLSIPMVADPQPEPTIIPLDTNVCPGGRSIFFAATSDTSNVLSWSTNAGASQIDGFSGESSLVYTVDWSNSVNSMTNVLIQLHELLNIGSACESTIIDSSLNFIDQGQAIEPAEILKLETNYILFYDDADVDCYQWGMINNGILDVQPGTSYEDSIFFAFPGETAQSFVANTNDLLLALSPPGFNEDHFYWCKAWNGECNDQNTCATYSVYNFKLSGNSDDPPFIEPEEIVDPFVLYPNPSFGQFNLDMNDLFEDERYNIQIWNVIGQKIHEFSFMSTSTKMSQTLDLDRQPEGLYFLTVFLRDEMRFRAPFIIQK